MAIKIQGTTILDKAGNSISLQNINNANVSSIILNGETVNTSGAELNAIDGIDTSNTIQSQIDSLDPILGTLSATLAPSATSNISLSRNVVAPIVDATLTVQQSFQNQKGFATDIDPVFYYDGRAGLIFANVLSADNNNIRSMTFNNDGTKMFVTDNSATEVLYEYALSTPYDVSSGSVSYTTSASFPSTVVGSFRYVSSMQFNDDGTKLYVLVPGNNSMYEVALTAGPYDISGGITYTNNSFSISSQVNSSVYMFTFADNGSAMFVSDSSSNAIFKYDLSTPYDITTAVFDATESLYYLNSLGGALANARIAVQVSSDGEYMYLIHTPPVTGFDTYYDTTMYIFKNYSDNKFNFADDFLENYVGSVTLMTANQNWLMRDVTIRNNRIIVLATNQDNQERLAGTDLDLAIETASSATAFDHYNSAPAEDIVVYANTLKDVTYVGKSGTLTLSGGVLVNDGQLFFSIDSPNSLIKKHSLSNQYTIDSLNTNASQSYNVSATAGSSNIFDVKFNNDGTKMYVAEGSVGITLYQYSLSTAWDLSTVTYDGAGSGLTTQWSIYSFTFNSDGTKLYTADLSREIHQYSLSTPWDLATATSDGVEFTVSSGDMFTILGMDIEDGGEFLYVTGRGDNDDPVIGQFQLETPYDISSIDTSKFIYKRFAYDTNESTNIKMCVTGTRTGSPSHCNFYLILPSNGNIRQYRFDKVTINSIVANGQFTSSDLYKTIDINGGKAIINEITNGDVTGAKIVDRYLSDIYDHAFSTYTANSGNWSLSSSYSNTSIAGIMGGYEDGYDLSASAFNGIIAFNERPEGMGVNRSGSKFFVFDSGDRAIRQYNLTSPFDLTTRIAGTTSQASLTLPISSIISIWIGGPKNSSVDYLFWMSGQTDVVYRSVSTVNLETNNISSFSVGSQSFSTVSQISSSKALVVSPDGTRMFVSDQFQQYTYEYYLRDAFDLSTAGYTNRRYSTEGEGGHVVGLDFNDDGTKLFMGLSNDIIIEVELTGEPYSFDGAETVTYSRDTNASTLSDVCFSRDGGKRVYYGDSEQDQIRPYVTYTQKRPALAVGISTANAQLDTSYWDINSINPIEGTGSSVYYAVSHDDQTTWKVMNSNDGEREIARDNSGTWQYNADGPYSLEAIKETYPGYSSNELATSLDPNVFSLGAGNIWRAISFNDDGTKFFGYTQDGTSGDIFKTYNLSTAYDMSTASYAGAQSHNFNNCIDFEFREDGLRLYYLEGGYPNGGANNTIYERSLTTAFDLSTLATTNLSSQSLYTLLGNQVGQYTAFTFSNGSPVGTYLFFTYASIDGSPHKVYRSSLNIGYNIDGGSITEEFELEPGEIPDGITFSPDGKHMFISRAQGGGFPSTNARTEKYRLGESWSLKTATYTGEYVEYQTNNEQRDVILSATGDKLFWVGDHQVATAFMSTGGFANTIWVDAPENNAYSAIQSAVLASTYNQMDNDVIATYTGDTRISSLGNDIISDSNKLDFAFALENSGFNDVEFYGLAINYNIPETVINAIHGTDYSYTFTGTDQVTFQSTASTTYKFDIKVI